MSSPNHSIDGKFRFLLFPLALFYWGMIFWRNLFYQIRFFISRRLPCKVISIGNLTTGGTGKTPMVIALAQLLKKRGKSVAILSRGYGRTTSGMVLVTDGKTVPGHWQGYGDEPYLMAKILSDIPIAVDENRYHGGLFLVRKFNPEIIILDDAFQHRALERDLDIVLINSGDRRPDHKLLPYGKLREPWLHLRRANIVILTKTNLNHPAPFLQTKLKRLPIPWYSSTLEPALILKGMNQSQLECQALAGKKVLTVSAVGDPAGFNRTVKLNATTIVESITYPDHHVYTRADLVTLQRKIETSGAELIITTEKDFIKFENLTTDLPIFALPIRFTLDQAGERMIMDSLFT